MPIQHTKMCHLTPLLIHLNTAIEGWAAMLTGAGGEMVLFEKLVSYATLDHHVLLNVSRPNIELVEVRKDVRAASATASFLAPPL